MLKAERVRAVMEVLTIFQTQDEVDEVVSCLFLRHTMLRRN